MPAPTLSTPADELSGLPLPIFVTPENYEGHQTNFHHLWHPRLSVELLDIGGLAVRTSYGADLPIYMHQRSHDTFTGPPLPQSDEDKFRLACLACAGVVPRKAIELFDAGGYEIIELDNDEHLFISNKIHIERAQKPKYEYINRNKIGKFFAQYALRHGLEAEIPKSLIRKFLKAEDRGRREELGSFILAKAINVAASALTAAHIEARREGLVQESRDGTPTQVVRAFFVGERFKDYLDPLEENLTPLAG